MRPQPAPSSRNPNTRHVLRLEPLEDRRMLAVAAVEDWATYIGGDDRETDPVMAVDAEGNVLVAGNTESAGWVSGGFDTIFEGGNDSFYRGDAFVAQMSPTGEHVWSTYVGGSQGGETSNGIAVDSAGNVLVAGQTGSPGWVSGGHDTEFNEGMFGLDSYIIKLSPAGDHLWSTYLGLPDDFFGGGGDFDASSFAYDVTVDSEDNVLVTGGWDLGLNVIAIVAKFSPTGEHVWDADIRGVEVAWGTGIAVDSADNILVSGGSIWSDAFVAKLDSSGNGQWTKDLGEEYANDIAVDVDDNILVTGYSETNSSEAFLVKISPQGEHLWRTSIGGDNDDEAHAVTVDADGSAFVTGFTRSTDWVSGGLITTLDGSSDAFVAKINPSGSHLWSTYFPNGGIDDIVVDSQRRIWLVGTTGSSDWSAGGFDTTYNGGGDAFVTSIADVVDEAPRVVDSSVHEGDVQAVGDLVFSAQFSRPLDSESVSAENVVLVGDTTGRITATSINYTAVGTATLTASFPILVEDQYTLTLPGGEGGLIGWQGRRLDGEPHATTLVPSGDGTEGGDFEVHFSVDDTPPRVIASSILDGDIVPAGAVVYAVQFSEPIIADDLDIFNVRLASEQHGFSVPLQSSYEADSSTLTLAFDASPGDLFSLMLFSGSERLVDQVGNHLDGERHATTTVPSGDGTAGGDFEVNFSVEGSPPVIDSEIDWVTYLGGSSTDEGSDIVIDDAGNVLVAGKTWSSGWVSGGYDTTFGGGRLSDSFVAKLNSTSEPLWSTYLGGDHQDSSVGIAVDSAGNVLAAGTTWSSGWVSGGYDTTLGGTRDAFVVKLSPTGEHLWSTYVGGSVFDIAGGIAVDVAGNVLVTGTTQSSGWVSGGYDTAHESDDVEAFVVKLSPTGEHLWSTYLGGEGRESGFGVAGEAAGNVVVTGTTRSIDWAAGGFDTSFNGREDAFVLKLSATGEHLWSTYLGGTHFDVGGSVVLDSGNNVLVTGQTLSTDLVQGDSTPCTTAIRMPSSPAAH